VRALDTIRSCDLALGFMRDGDMCLSLGTGAEAVNLSRAARIRLLGEPGTHESDCRRRYLWRDVLPWTNRLQGYLYRLTDRGGHALPTIPVIGGQHMPWITRLRRGVLSASITVKNPQ
jgi:hypothetical protein